MRGNETRLNTTNQTLNAHGRCLKARSGAGVVVTVIYLLVKSLEDAR